MIFLAPVVRQLAGIAVPPGQQDAVPAAVPAGVSSLVTSSIAQS